MTETLGTALERQAATPAQKTVLDLIDRMAPEIARALPAHLDSERFRRLVVTELRRNPTLMECTPDSLLGAMMLSAQVGLEPGPLGHVYLVPFKREVTFIIGYRGMIELAYRSDQVRDVKAALVYDGDAFEWREGSRPFLDHTPSGPPAERELTHAWATARLRNGGTVFAVIFPEDWERAKAQSPAGRKNVGPWVDHFPAMVRKTAVRRLQPFLPQSPQLARAVERDEQPAPLLDEAEIGADANGR